MCYDQVNKVEEYLNSKKKIQPSDVRFARRNLLLIKDDMRDEQLRDIKIYYQGQLSSSQFFGNFIGLISLIVAVLTALYSAISTSSWIGTTIIGFMSLIIFLLLLKLNRITEKSAKKNITYTIIINLIDEILEKHPPN